MITVTVAHTARIGDWMQTANGRQFWPLDPRPDEVHLDDIAHALSMMCRFNSHCSEFYSVAEHSVRVSRILPYDLALVGLMHDAAEAYVVDVPRPLKRSLVGYKAIEEAVERAIATRYGLPFPWHPAVKCADEVLLATEARDLIAGECLTRWGRMATPLEERIEPWSPDKARAMFHARFCELLGGIG